MVLCLGEKWLTDEKGSQPLGFSLAWGHLVSIRGYPVDHLTIAIGVCQHSGCPLLCNARHPFSCWQHGHDIVQQYQAISWHFELWKQKHNIPHS